MKAILNLLKIIVINFLIFFIFIIIIEIFFGQWFKNKFFIKLSSERNISRIYEVNFENYSNKVNYKRNNYGFRYNDNNYNPDEIDIVFIGGSTTNQKFLNYEKTIVGIIEKKFNNKKIVNAGIDGLSIKGHIKSFDFWFDKIDKFNPEYYVFYIGINDQFILHEKEKLTNSDSFVEPSLEKKIRWYIKANSFFYLNIKKLQTYLVKKYNINYFNRVVNKKTKVYGERNTTNFIKYKEIENKNNLTNKFYITLLEKLTAKVHNKNAKIIYITQISGNGMSENLFIIANSILKHCKEYNLKCINLAKYSNLEFDDFYDWTHLNPKGSKKAAEYIFSELNKIIN